MEVIEEAAGLAKSAEDFFVADWLVQPSMGIVTRQSFATHLEPKTMRVLACLAAHAGAVVSKEELLNAVWPKTFVTEHVLSQAVWQLRQAFSGTEVVQTIPRRGYRLLLPVRAIMQGIRSIAVLPLTNLSADPEQEYFADGITEALIGALAQIGSLRVISRTSSMQYKGKQESVPQIAAKLGVDALVEGSVIRVRGRVRITVQLILAASDEHLWARTYDRELTDILRVQDEVVLAIASEVRVTLTADEESRLARSRPVEPAAHEAYLKGRYCYFRMSEPGLRLSMEHMRRAIAADPQYAPAYAGLAGAASVLSRMSLMVPEEANAIVQKAIAHALDLDPALSDAHCVLGGSLLYYDWDWKGAERALRHAIELNPSSSTAFGALAELYEALNQSEEAIRCWSHACRLDPLSVFFPVLLGGTLVLAERPKDAAEQLRTTLRQEPNYWLGHEILSFALADLELYAEAIEAAATAVRLSPDPIPQTALGYVCARAGRTDETRRILDEFDRLSKSRYVSPLVFAALLTALGDKARGLDYLEKGCAVRDPVIVLVRSFPFWRPLRSDPRYRAIVRRLQFPN
ncbi:MAG TPA: winged helix-turn-helix domain-containing protein [Terriglobales bacterium]|nr:winged helix-turn-helix domain-containing protein [Terriglobales bacterium]